MKKKETEITKEAVAREEIAKASEILQKYKEGKATLDNKIKENEEWYKQRHWKLFGREEEKNKLQPSSAWLFNSIENKHADAMDNFPEPNVLARTADDEGVSKELSTILPVLLESSNYEQVYSDTWRYKLKAGTGVKKIFWNSKKANGLGDIEIKKIDVLNIFCKPGITDIQDSPHVFHVEIRDNEELKAEYPDLDLQLGNSPTFEVTKYAYDENIDTSNTSSVVDWYYKKNGAVHYCKYVNDAVLYASENDPELAERGFYDHGLYPFVLDPLFTVEGSPFGFSYIDIMKDAQMYIDKMDSAILENILISSRKRWFAREGAGLNEEEYLDLDKPFVHMEGSTGEDAIREITHTPLSNICVTVKEAKIDELKETSNNRDFSQGSTSSGVTAMGAIVALQEAGSKQSRDMIKASYRAFQKECYMIIELLRQFYELPRYFRIIGEDYKTDYIPFDNSKMQPVAQTDTVGSELGERLPIFDIKVSASKKSYYSRESQNQTMIQFFQLGFFNPQLADQALLCLEAMDFEKKEKIVEGIKQNGTMYQQMIMMQQQMQKLAAIVDMQNGTSISQGMTEEGQETQMPQGGSIKSEETGRNEKTAQTIRQMTTPQ